LVIIRKENSAVLVQEWEFIITGKITSLFTAEVAEFAEGKSPIKSVTSAFFLYYSAVYFLTLFGFWLLLGNGFIRTL
jgi:hypothetical protein